jgi:exosortase/archaeosortase family protein
MRRKKKRVRRVVVNVKSSLHLAIEFLLYFVLFFVVAYAVLSFFPLKALAAYSSNVFLNLFEVDSKVVEQGGEYFLQSPQFTAQIVDLCSGAIELAVLFAVIFSTLDRSLWQRIKGVVLGFFLALLVNPLRIAITLLYSKSLFLLVFVHEIFFRLSLVALIVIYYAIWYSWLSAPGKRFFKRSN